MGWLDQALVLLAGVGAGTINTMVGSGTLITFPILVLLGVPPVEANISNTVGLVPGSLSGAIGYRRELAGQRRRLVVLGTAAVLGGLTGGLLLLSLPAAAFDAIVPALILVALVAVLAQPRLAAWVARRTGNDGGHHGDTPGTVTGLLWLGAALTGVYGGYFGAAQGVLLLALLGVFVPEHLQRLNAAKNVLAMLNNAVAALLFIVVAEVNWQVALLVAIGSAIGGQVGAGIGRRLPASALRGLIVVVGLVAVVRLVA